MSGGYGFGIVEINQASGQAETLATDEVFRREGDADDTAAAFQEFAVSRGRADRYVVVELRARDEEDSE